VSAFGPGGTREAVDQVRINDERKARQEAAQRSDRRATMRDRRAV